MVWKPPFHCSRELLRENEIIDGHYDIHWLEKYLERTTP